MTQRKTRQAADAADGLVTLGLLLLGVAVWILWGFAVVLAYCGTVALLFGIALAIHRGRWHDSH